MRITKLQTKNNFEINIGKFTVLVGPNNVGKSQSLRDISLKMVSGPNARTMIITSVELEKPENFEQLFEGLRVVKDPKNMELHQVRGIQSSLTAGDTLNLNLDNLKKQFENHSNMDFILGNLSKFRVSYLDASSRLKVAQSAASHNPHTQPPSNLLQGLFGSELDEETELRNAFKQTFGMDIRLDYSGMTQLSLRVSDVFDEIPGDPREAYPFFKNISRLDDQGDGFRSYVGVVLSLLLSKGRVVLLDEPEAFLHPAQARQLGYWIAEYSKKSSGQIIVATHNASFLSGILSSDQSVDIYRLNRNKDVTKFTLVSAHATSNLAKSPLLSSQRVLEAIFYKGVIVCEADADRALYYTVASQEHSAREILFIHAHNKQTIPQVVALLREASIPVCAIADIDAINSSTDLGNLVKALDENADIQSILDDREKIALSIEKLSEADALDKLKSDVKELHDQLNKNKHSLAGARGALNRIRGKGSKWVDVKQRGVSAIPLLARKRGKSIILATKTSGLFLVPVRELESWLDLGTRQKNKWIVLALNAIHEGNCSSELRDFVGEVIAFLENAS